jgi:hypothetical protein
MLQLEQVTLIGIDCVDFSRLQLAADISCREITFSAVKLLTSEMSDDPRAISIAPLMSIDAYSQFCLRELDRYIDTPYALIIQHDGFVLNASAWDEAYLTYDYLGAPARAGTTVYGYGAVPPHVVGTLVVGNGGFSLRSKKLLELTATLIARGDFDPDGPEDWVQCYTNRALLESNGIRFAPSDLAERFSFEGRSKDYYRWQDSFGFHSLKWTDISAWLKEHPEYRDSLKNEVRLEELE